MGCILYELALLQKAFFNDYEAFEYYRQSKTDLNVTLDETFSEQCKNTIVKSINSMLRTEPLSRPSATELFEEFCRNCQFTEVHYGQPGAISPPGTLNISLQGSNSIWVDEIRF